MAIFDCQYFSRRFVQIISRTKKLAAFAGPGKIKSGGTTPLLVKASSNKTSGIEARGLSTALRKLPV